MKTCSKCHKLKPLSYFYTDRRAKDGRTSSCKQCKQTTSKRYYYSLNTEDRLKISRASSFGRVRKKRDRKKYSAAYYLKNKSKLLKDSSDYYQNNKSTVRAKLSILMNNRSLDYDRYKHLITVDLTFRVVENNLIEVCCYKCGKLFKPRLADLRSHYVDNSLCNLYCSDVCKTTCSVFNRRLYQKGFKDSVKARSCQTNHLKQLQCDEFGYNYCERCGDIINVDLHHTHPVGTKEAINSSGHILLCPGCHTNLERSC